MCSKLTQSTWKFWNHSIQKSTCYRMRSLYFSFFLIEVSTATERFIATWGSNANTGDINSPLQTIQACADVSIPGDTCFIRGGSYGDLVSVVNRDGTEDAFITFTNYNNERVVMDGTTKLDLDWSIYTGLYIRSEDIISIYLFYLLFVITATTFVIIIIIYTFMYLLISCLNRTYL